MMRKPQIWGVFGGIAATISVAFVIWGKVAWAVKVNESPIRLDIVEHRMEGVEFRVSTLEHSTVTISNILFKNDEELKRGQRLEISNMQAILQTLQQMQHRP